MTDRYQVTHKISKKRIGLKIASLQSAVIILLRDCDESQSKTIIPCHKEV